MRRQFVAAVLAGVTLAACGGDDPGDPTVVPPSTSPPPPTTTISPVPVPTTAAPTFAGTVITVRVSGGKVETASRRVSVRRGSDVRLVVTSDVADEVHVHGVNIRQEIAAGETVTLDFRATVAGTQEIELERSRLVLVELRVS